jgi:hypothetical protein
MPTQVLKDGTIVPSVDAPSHPGALAQVVAGSPIQAAAASVNDKTTTQAEAISVLGAKVGGRRRRTANLRRVLRMMRGGDVEIKNVPNMPSAGGIDPKATFAKMLEVQHQAAADAQFDGLGDAPAKVLPPVGGRRHKKKTLKHKKNGSRTKHRSVRKHRGSSRRTHRVRRHRR